jgi:DNA polymerase (family 10)
MATTERAMMDRRAVASVLEQIAQLMELKGENAFRTRAFVSAARTIAGLPGDLAAMLADGTLAATRGIGPATLQIVTELVETGRSTVLEELREQVPPGLVEMLQISGLGVAKIRQIHDTLDIDSIPELEAAARDGRLAALPRFGAKTAENILRGIGFLRQASAFRLSHHAAEEAEALRASLEKLEGVQRAVIAGDVRRRAEVVRDLSIVIVAEAAPAEIFARLRELPGILEFAGQDERRSTLHFEGGTQAQVIVTTPVNFGAVLVQATGGEAHLRALSERARAQGCNLAGAALWRGSTFVPTPDEATLYRALGLAWIPPELREGRDELDLAARDGIPPLLEASELRGFLHCHTIYSDGTNTVEEMARAAQALGYAYIGITDHSSAAAYAGGLSADDLRRQCDEIDALDARLDGIRVFKGVEADILQDGTLDYGDDVLARLDFVIGSIHSRFTMTREEMTARVLAAMDSPYLTILGHPTGRLLLQREAYPLDLDAVIAKAAATGVALEINADPHRLDLDWRVLRRVREAGAMISIGADAHNVAGMTNVAYGVGIARKGMLGPADVLNTRTAEEFLAFARRRRG